MFAISNSDLQVGALYEQTLRETEPILPSPSSYLSPPNPKEAASSLQHRFQGLIMKVYSAAAGLSLL